MKKLFKEEKAGLKIELKILKIILFAFFLSHEIYPQIPINGFCKFSSFIVNPDFNSLLTLNYNNDSYTDIVLYNPLTKTIASLTGRVNGAFDKPEISTVPYQITDIQNLIEKNKVVKRYAFTSRESMRAGIYSFTGRGKAVLTSSIRFKSYPENISTADMNQNGKDEMLISGSAFNGLSIISQSRHGLTEKKIIENTSFSEAVFADLRNDGYSDIAAFNIISNSLYFFYNNGSGDFSLVRTIHMGSPIRSLKAVDLNLDNYTDLLFGSEHSIIIMYGDFASAYDHVEKIKTEYTPDQIITGDFNRDGKIDIAYINRKNNIMSVIFAKSDSTFYPEMVYFQKENLKNLVPYYSKFINGIAALSSSGVLYTLTNLLSFSSNASIALSAEPSSITSFDYNNNGITDICYIDKFSRTLDLIIRNSYGIPSYFYSYPLYEDHGNILVDNSGPAGKTFYCYSPGKKLIEVLTVNLNKNYFERNSIYSPGKILDVKIHRQFNQNNIYIAYNKNNELGFSIVEFHDYRYTYTNYFNIAPGPVEANISFGKNLKIIYWYRIKDSSILSEVSFIGGVESKISGFIYSLNNAENIVTYTEDILNSERNVSISFFKYKDKNGAIIFNDNDPAQIVTKELPDYFRIFNTGQLYYGRLKLNGLNKLCVYLPGENILAKLDFINKGKDFNITKISDAKDIQSYFIKNMSYRSYNLVYIDSTANCINIQQL